MHIQQVVAILILPNTLSMLVSKELTFKEDITLQ